MCSDKHDTLAGDSTEIQQHTWSPGRWIAPGQALMDITVSDATDRVKSVKSVLHPFGQNAKVPRTCKGMWHASHLRHPDPRCETS